MRNTDYSNWGNERGSDGHRYEWPDDTELSIAAIEAVAAVSGRDPTEIEPLHESLDPDALDALFQSGRETTVDGTVSFSFADHRIVAHGDGELVVYPLE